MSMRQAQIYRKGILAGTLTEDGGEYTFCYDTQYLSSPQAVAISLTLPLQPEAYTSPVLFPFFDGLAGLLFSSPIFSILILFNISR